MQRLNQITEFRGQITETRRGTGNRSDEQRARQSHAPTRERSSREAARFARSADLAEFGVQITEYR